MRGRRFFARLRWPQNESSARPARPGPGGETRRRHEEFDQDQDNRRSAGGRRADPGGAEDPFATDLGGSGSDESSSLVQRRDGSQATPFIAEAGPEASTAAATSVADDGFEIGAAAIGAGLGLLVAALAVLGTGAIRDRREHSHQGAPAATH